jgi:hypothetical protein
MLTALYRPAAPAHRIGGMTEASGNSDVGAALNQQFAASVASQQKGTDQGGTISLVADPN